MSKLLLCPVAILSAAVLISIGCNRSGDNGESAGVTPPAANRPEGAGSKAGASEKTAIETPPGILPGPAPLAGANGAKLKPLEFSMPAGKAAPLDEIEPKPLFKPLPIETTKKIAAKNPMPASPLVAKAADEPVVSQKPREVGVGGRVNPLRANSRPALAKNPIRAGGAKQPQALQPLPDKPLPQKPAGVLSEKKVDSSPAAKMPAAKMPAAKMPEKAAPKFDPIKVNGPIFEGWTKPKLAIVITGREDGYLEPCGCAGLDSMKGGMSRRHTMIESLRKKGWPLLCVDVGGLSKGYGVQAELKFQITVDAMKKMGYEAIGFSPNDLRLPVGLLVAVADDSKDNPSPFVSADVGLLGFDADITAQWRVVDVGGIKVGVTSVLGKDFAQGLAGDDIEIEDPESALARIVPELKKRCKLMILLAYATVENSSELSKKFPEFAVVATAGGPPSPPAKPTIIKETKALLIEVGEKGMDAIVLGLYANEKEPYRYQRVPLDSRFKSSKDMKNLMVTYQDRLRTLGLEGLAIKPVMHSDQAINGEFVGFEGVRGLPRSVIRRVEEVGTCQGLGHAAAYRSAARCRSRMHKLPCRRLAPHQTLPLQKRIPQREDYAENARRRLRIVPRSRRPTCEGRNGQRQGVSVATAKSRPGHHGRRQRTRGTCLPELPRPGQQPGLQFRHLLAESDAQGKRIGR